MAGEIHRSKVGTYHPAPCKCETRQDWKDCQHPNTKSIHATDTEWPYRDCLDCGASLLHKSVICRCNNVAWTIHDTRGTIDGGSACDECGKCECAWCECAEHLGKEVPRCQTHFSDDADGDCIGLSFAFVCLDGGETLCEECAEKAGITIVECDCK